MIKIWEADLEIGHSEVKAGNARIRQAEKRIRDIKDQFTGLTFSDGEPRAKKAKAGKTKGAKVRVKVEEA